LEQQCYVVTDLEQLAMYLYQSVDVCNMLTLNLYDPGISSGSADQRVFGDTFLDVTIRIRIQEVICCIVNAALNENRMAYVQHYCK